ncbi:MAG: hypothetical protein AB7V55_07230 [Oscillospiraceae bacterium]
MKKAKSSAMLFCCFALLLACAGCTPKAPPSSVAPESTEEQQALPTPEIPAAVEAYNIESDLPEGCNGLEVYGFGYDDEAERGFIVCRAMAMTYEDAEYVGEDVFTFRLASLPSVDMWDHLIAGYDGLSSFQDGGGLAGYYDRVVETIGYFPPLRAFYTFDDDGDIRWLQDAFYRG